MKKESDYFAKLLPEAVMKESYWVTVTCWMNYGINITISKYVLTSSYSINIILKDEEKNSNELTKENNANENNTIEPLPIEDNATHLDEEGLICE